MFFLTAYRVILVILSCTHSPRRCLRARGLRLLHRLGHVSITSLCHRATLFPLLVALRTVVSVWGFLLARRLQCPLLTWMNEFLRALWLLHACLHCSTLMVARVCLCELFNLYFGARVVLLCGLRCAVCWLVSLFPLQRAPFANLLICRVSFKAGRSLVLHAVLIIQWSNVLRSDS